MKPLLTEAVIRETIKEMMRDEHFKNLLMTKRERKIYEQMIKEKQ